MSEFEARLLRLEARMQTQEQTTAAIERKVDQGFAEVLQLLRERSRTREQPPATPADGEPPQKQQQS